MDLATLLKAKTKLVPTFKATIERLSKSNSKIAAAFKAGYKP